MFFFISHNCIFLRSPAAVICTVNYLLLIGSGDLLLYDIVSEIQDKTVLKSREAGYVGVLIVKS